MKRRRSSRRIDLDFDENDDAGTSIPSEKDPSSANEKGGFNISTDAFPMELIHRIWGDRCESYQYLRMTCTSLWNTLPDYFTLFEERYKLLFAPQVADAGNDRESTNDPMDEFKVGVFPFFVIRMMRRLRRIYPGVGLAIMARPAAERGARYIAIRATYFDPVEKRIRPIEGGSPGSTGSTGFKIGKETFWITPHKEPKRSSLGESKRMACFTVFVKNPELFLHLEIYNLRLRDRRYFGDGDPETVGMIKDQLFFVPHENPFDEKKRDVLATLAGGDLEIRTCTANHASRCRPRWAFDWLTSIAERFARRQKDPIDANKDRERRKFYENARRARRDAYDRARIRIYSMWNEQYQLKEFMCYEEVHKHVEKASLRQKKKP